jgi:hypothetical protein
LTSGREEALKQIVLTDPMLEPQLPGDPIPE